MRRRIFFVALVAFLFTRLSEPTVYATCPPSSISITITSSPFALVNSKGGPKVATLSAKIQNTGTGPANNVIIYIGDGTTPGAFPDVSGQSLQMLGPTSDARRPLDNLAAGEARFVYWQIKFPFTFGVAYPYTVWATSDDGCSAAQNATLETRSSTPANANKILPTGASVTVQPNSSPIGGLVTVTITGFDLGAIGAGPQAIEDAWLQPISNLNFDPTCLRLVKTEVLLGSISTTPFMNQLYFAGISSTNPPPNYSRDPADYVKYTFIGLRNCSTNIQPYQQAASGNEEGYNSDIGAINLNVQVSEGELILNKSVSPTRASPGTTLTYTISYGNTGVAPLGDPDSGNAVTIVDQLVPTDMTYIAGSSTCSASCLKLWSTDGGMTFVSTEPSSATSVNALRWVILDPIPAGQNPAGTVGFQVTATGAGEICNTAQAAIDGTTPIASDTACANSATDVQITKTGPSTVLPGGPLTYTLTYRNNGPSVAEDVVVTDTLPTDAQFVSSSPLPSSIAGQVLTYTIGTLNANQSGSIVIQASANSSLTNGTVLTNNVQILTITPETDTSNNTASLNTTVGTGGPILEAAKVAFVVEDAPPLGAGPGDTLEYTVTLTNTGSATATNVVFLDTPDPNTALVIGSVTTTAGTIALGNTAGDSQVRVEIATVAANSSAAIAFRVRINSPLPEGVKRVRNQGIVSSNELPDEPTDDPNTTTPDDPTETALSAAVLLKVTKSASIFNDLDGDCQASPGDILKYTITITNLGDENAGSVALTDELDPNVTLVINSVTTTQGIVLSGSDERDSFVQVDIGTLTGNGGSATVTFRVGINSPLPGGVNQVANQALISGSNFPSQPSDDPATPAEGDPTVTLVLAEPKLSVTKRDFLKVDIDKDGVPSPGDTLGYHILIINNGNADASNLFFSDTPDPNTNLIVGSTRTSQGTVLTGNTVGDASVSISLDTIPGLGGTVEISFDVTIKDPFPTNATGIANQALVNVPGFDSQLSDDPDTPAQADPTRTPVAAAPQLLFTKSAYLVSDEDGNGEVSAGETLEYVLTILNLGHQDATNVFVADTPDPNTRLINGTILISQGIVGNNSGSANINIGTIGARGGHVQLSFRVRINNPLPVNSVTNQALISSSNVSSQNSDDPRTPAPHDPTVTIIGSFFILCGDADNDGDVDFADAQLVGRAAIGAVQLTEQQRAAADVSAPIGVIDVRDATVILEIAQGYRRQCPPIDSAGGENSAPLQVERFFTEGRAVTFTAQGQGITEMSVQVFDLTGRMVFTSGWQSGNRLQWRALTDDGRPVANGVYLYVIHVRGADGTTIRSRVQKLVVLR